MSGCGSGSDDEPAKPAVFERVDLLSAVEPRIGTGGIGFGVGSTYPGPAVPFAMIHPSPDTRTDTGAIGFNHCAGYHAGDPYISAFSLLHFEGTGVPDYGTIGIIPALGMSDEKRAEDKRMLPFSASDEAMRPGYYKVRLGGQIDVEISSSLRAASFRFGFPDGQSPVLILDLDHHLEGQILAADITHSSGGTFDAHVKHFGDMSGSAGGYDVYAHGVVDVAPSQVGTFDASALHAGQTQASGTPLGAWLEFPAGTKTVNLRVAVSFVDAAGAQKNLDTEAPSFDFSAMQSAAEASWKEAFDRFEVYGANAYDTQVMGTALYHALLMPTLMSDADGRFIGVAGNIATGTRGRYNDFSLWDTYRTLHPWLLLSENEHNQDFAASLVAMAEEGGAVPVWGIAHGDSKTMIGSPGEIVLAESAQKGVAFDDENAAYSLARVAAYGPSPGPVGGRDDDLDEYLALGYVPAEVSGGSVSKTQEYAVADAALGHWAERLGNAADADELGARGQNYRHHYDSESGFFRAKKSDGSFTPMGLPTAMDDAYVEGNAWHYLWMAPHDPEGLAETLGGKDSALARLREFFEASENEQPLVGVRQHYWPSNEPDINAPWLFAAWGSPGESARYIDWIVTELYGQGTDGLPGNDDGGTMSAWLLFAGAGLYPISGTDRYIVASPRYPKIVLHRASGDLTIEASPAPTPELGPKRVSLDGKPLTSTTITHGELVGTHTLRFEMTKLQK